MLERQVASGAGTQKERRQANEMTDIFQINDKARQVIFDQNPDTVSLMTWVD